MRTLEALKMLRSRVLTPTQGLVYAYVAHRAGVADGGSGYCNVAIANMALDLGLNERTVRRTLHELVALRVLTAHDAAGAPGPSKGGRRKRNSAYLLTTYYRLTGHLPEEGEGRALARTRRQAKAEEVAAKKAAGWVYDGGAWIPPGKGDPGSPLGGIVDPEKGDPGSPNPSLDPSLLIRPPCPPVARDREAPPRTAPSAPTGARELIRQLLKERSEQRPVSDLARYLDPEDAAELERELERELEADLARRTALGDRALAAELLHSARGRWAALGVTRARVLERELARLAADPDETEH